MKNYTLLKTLIICLLLTTPIMHASEEQQTFLNSATNFLKIAAIPTLITGTVIALGVTLYNYFKMTPEKANELFTYMNKKYSTTECDFFIDQKVNLDYVRSYGKAQQSSFYFNTSDYNPYNTPLHSACHRFKQDISTLQSTLLYLDICSQEKANTLIQQLETIMLSVENSSEYIQERNYIQTMRTMKKLERELKSNRA